jgi:hypothetical protein
MQLVEIKIAQLNHRPMYSVSERINGGEWSIQDYGISINSADILADELWHGALDAGHSVKCFYQWSDNKRTYKS